MLTVSLIEDDDVLRVILSRSIRSNKQLQLLSAYSTAEEALKDLPREKPAVALVDIQLPGVDGIECIRRLRAIVPALPTHFIILTANEDSDLIFESLKAGAHGYLLKGHTPRKKLFEALKEVADGGAPLTPIIARKVIAHFERAGRPVTGLSKRELEVLIRLAHGLTYKEIANELSISLNTVQTHVESIYNKLHVHSRTDAAMYYVQRHGSQPGDFRKL